MDEGLKENTEAGTIYLQRSSPLRERLKITALKTASKHSGKAVHWRADVGRTVSQDQQATLASGVFGQMCRDE